MHAERDYLRSHVFPELAERLSTRQISVEAVDLRWGVDTSVAEVDHDLIVLKVCLGEVKRCLPFFIGIIGDRYGSILPDPRLEDAAVEAGLNTRVVGKSVTDLEIEFAALTRPHNARSAYFYLREPLPYAQMPADIADAVRADSYDPEGLRPQSAPESSARLKQRLEAELPAQTRRFRVEWDAKNQKVTGLRQFGEMIISDLLSAFAARIDQSPPTADWHDEERWALERFIEERARIFVGREAELARLTSLASGGGQPDTRLGPSA